MAIVMSVDSNKLLLPDTPYKPYTLYAHVSQSARQPSEKEKVIDSEERQQHQWSRTSQGSQGSPEEE